MLILGISLQKISWNQMFTGKCSQRKKIKDEDCDKLKLTYTVLLRCPGKKKI